MEFIKNWSSKLPYKSKLSRFKDINKRNIKFKSLSLEDQKKEIALDVLNLLSTENINASISCYMSFYDDVYQCNDKEIFKLLNDNEFFNKINNDYGCQVCARGAMMLSTIRLGNSIDPSNDVRFDKGDEYNQEYFTFNEYNDMEYQYEHGTEPYYHNTNGLLANIFLQIVHTGTFDIENKTDYLKDIFKIPN